MQKKKWKIITHISIFLLLFLALFYVADTTLKFKYDDGIRPITDMYQLPENSIDVLLLGSSHIGANIDTTQLCSDYGIAAYKLWGTTQPIWNSYFYLVEALKTQSPKVVVLETLSLSHDIEYQKHVDSIKNTMGLKWSLNKVNAINDSFAPEYRKDAYFPFSLYHSRYAELTDDDFTSYFWNYKSGEKNVENWTAICDSPLPSETEVVEPVAEKELLYFKKIISLCKENNIPLVMVTEPYSIGDLEKSRLNSAKLIFEEEGLLYLDCLTNYKDYDINYSLDFGDSAGHLNSGGIIKVTAALGEYLKKNYELPDRTGDANFAYNVPVDASYVLTGGFVGDSRSKFIDTKQRLFDDANKNFTILTKFSTSCDSNEKILFSCFSENEPYRGLMVRLTDDNKLDIIVGNNSYFKTKLPAEATATLAITKLGNSYSVFMNSELLTTVESECESYNGNLIIGAENLSDGSIGKLSSVEIQKFELYEKVLSNSEIKTWMDNNAQAPTRDEMIEKFENMYSDNFEYSLTESFSGDGTSKFIDTGVQLYGEASSEWTLLADINVNSEDGVYFSCFSEEENNYRGILVRKVNDELQILYGNGKQIQVKVYESISTIIAIVKSGDNYSIYLDGNLIATDQSTCDVYLGTLLVGCQYDNDFSLYRFSELNLNRLQVFNGIIAVDEIKLW